MRAIRLSSPLFTIAANLCKDYLKWRERHPETSLEALLAASEKPSELVEAHTVDVEEEVEKRLLWQRVCEASAQLSPEHWTALVLKHYEGLSYEEIARVCACTVGTANSRVHYALVKLRQVLGVEVEDA